MVSDDATYGGPYLTTAVFCENVIEDKQGVLSLIRIIDRTTVTVSGPDAPEKMPQIPLTASLVLTFKAGFAKGSHTVRVRPKTPDGQPLPEVSVQMFLEGDDRGQNIVLPLRMAVDQEGVYWFDVYVGERLFTRTPFRLVYQRLSMKA